MQITPSEVPHPRCPNQGFGTGPCAPIGSNGDMFETPSLRFDRKQMEEGNERAPVNRKAVVWGLQEKVLTDALNLPRHALLICKRADETDDGV